MLIAGTDISAGLGLVGAVNSGAVQIDLDPTQIETIKGHLDDAQEALDEASVDMKVAISASVVGGSPQGQQLAQHSKLADEALRETLTRMEAGVVYYRDAIKTAVAGMTGADEAAAAATKKGQSSFSPTTGEGA